MNRIVFLRKQQKLTQNDLAVAVGVTYQAISGYENERREPSFDILCKMADFFCVSVDYLIGHDCADALAPMPEYARVYEALTDRSKELAMAYMKGLLTAEGKDVENVIFVQKRSVEKSGES